MKNNSVDFEKYILQKLILVKTKFFKEMAYSEIYKKYEKHSYKFGKSPKKKNCRFGQNIVIDN